MRGAVAAVQWVVGVAAVAAAIMLFTLHGQGSSQAGKPSDNPGATIYADRCAICHGSVGQGGTGPPLAGFVVDAFPDIEDEIEIVASGKRGMPAYSPSLSEDDIRTVVEYTRVGW